MYDPGTVNMHKGSIQMLAEKCRSKGPKGGFYDALHAKKKMHEMNSSTMP
jgi:hypothetical protein